LVPVTSYSPQDYALFFQEGEERGFAYFFRQLYPALTLFAYKLTGEKEQAEEIASNAFIKIWQRHHLFDTPESIRAYLYQIVRNDALKALQKAKRQRIITNDVTYLWKDRQETDYFHHLVTAETTRQLQESLDLLPSECRRIFHLLYIEGKSVKEVATELNLALSTVKTQKSRGLAVLKKRFAAFTFAISVWNLLY